MLATPESVQHNIDVLRDLNDNLASQCRILTIAVAISFICIAALAILCLTLHYRVKRLETPSTVSPPK